MFVSKRREQSKDRKETGEIGCSKCVPVKGALQGMTKTYS